MFVELSSTNSKSCASEGFASETDDPNVEYIISTMLIPSLCSHHGLPVVTWQTEAYGSHPLGSGLPRCMSNPKLFLGPVFPPRRRSPSHCLYEFQHAELRSQRWSRHLRRGVGRQSLGSRALRRALRHLGAASLPLLVAPAFAKRRRRRRLPGSDCPEVEPRRWSFEKSSG